MEKKRILLIAGGGTLGSYTALELLRMGCKVDVVALEDLTTLNRDLTYIKARADDALLQTLFAQAKYDTIVDFIHYPDPDFYRHRAKLLLANTKQLIFLSSYRVYADEEHPIRETSPQLLDVLKDADFLAQEKYAVPKSLEERILRESGFQNWTVIRPLISFSHFRLDLVTQGASQILLRAMRGRKILLPQAARHVTAGVGWAGNIGKMIARLVGNEKAYGEAFTLGSGEKHTWDEIAGYYTELIGAEFVWVDTDTYLANATENGYMDRCILNYDRLYDRTIDNAKMLAATGLSSEDFVDVRDALVYELDVLASRPDLVARFDTEGAAKIGEKMDAYLQTLD